MMEGSNDVEIKADWKNGRRKKKSCSPRLRIFSDVSLIIKRKEGSRRERLLLIKGGGNMYICAT